VKSLILRLEDDLGGAGGSGELVGLPAGHRPGPTAPATGEYTSEFRFRRLNFIDYGAGPDGRTDLGKSHEGQIA